MYKQMSEKWIRDCLKKLPEGQQLLAEIDASGGFIVDLARIDPQAPSVAKITPIDTSKGNTP